jgi:hypothetical protein
VRAKVEQMSLISFIHRILPHLRKKKTLAMWAF